MLGPKWCEENRNLKLFIVLGLWISGSPHFSPVLHFIQKPVISFAAKTKWQVSIWHATLGWNGLIKSQLSLHILTQSYNFITTGSYLNIVLKAIFWAWKLHEEIISGYFTTTKIAPCFLGSPLFFQAPVLQLY